MKKTSTPVPSAADQQSRRKTRAHARHERNPPGSKLVREFYLAKFGVRESYAKAAEWYRHRVDAWAKGIPTG